MKKYIVFILCFILMFTLFQVLAGIILTITYTPDIVDAWNASSRLSQETIIRENQNSFFLSLVIGLLSASIAYAISDKTREDNNDFKE